jgi:hypothetical protein
MKHPAFVQRLAIPPKPKSNCREGVVSIHTPGSGHQRSRSEIPERYCADSISFLTNRGFRARRSDRLVGKPGRPSWGGWAGALSDGMRTFRYPCIRDSLGCIPRRLHYRLSPVRREKQRRLHRKDAKIAKQIKRIDSELLI